MSLFWQSKKGKEASEKKANVPAKAGKASDTAKKPVARTLAPAKETKDLPKIVVAGYTKHDVFPRITEKATFLAERGVYVFNIGSNVSKGAVKDAISSLFKVQPLRVSIVNTPGKKIISKGRTGYSSAQKKAYVYLKEGDKIDIV